MEKKIDKTEREMGVGRGTREEIVKWNQMAALLFKTRRGRHQTSPASLGVEKKERERDREKEGKGNRQTDRQTESGDMTGREREELTRCWQGSASGRTGPGSAPAAVCTASNEVKVTKTVVY